MGTLKIEMTIEEWDIIYKLLQDTPYRISKSMIAKIEKASNEQAQADQKAIEVNSVLLNRRPETRKVNRSLQ